jgi:hypothetical protein
MTHATPSQTLPFARRLAALGAALLLSAPLSGCGSTLTPEEQQQQDIEEYEELTRDLEKNRVEVLGTSATTIAGAGTRLFWLEYPTISPELHSLNTQTGDRVTYAFSIDFENTYSYRVSRDIVVTVRQDGSNIRYEAYALDKPEELLGSLSFSDPGGGIKWYAYAPDAGDVYIVQQDFANDKNIVLKWTPGDAAANPVVTLEDIGVNVGEFLDFGVDGNTMIFIETGRIWNLDLAAKKATWLENETEAYGADFDDAGILFSTAKGPFFYRRETKQISDVAEAIHDAGYELNKTYKDIDEYDSGLGRQGDHLVYIGRSSLFTYDMKNDVVRPLLLSPREAGLRIDYTFPVVLEDGSIFVQTAESTSGAVGAKGKVYQVNVEL